MWYNDLRPKSELIPNKYAFAFYENKLKFSEETKLRTLDNLIRLKKGVVDKIPKKEVDRNILLATWNIKEFGHLNERLTESYFYIAEIINAFDIIAIQEIKSSVFDLEKVLKLLGKDWRYIITDITEGRKGNKERFGFIYDTRRVFHSGLSGEIVIPEEYSEDSDLDSKDIKKLKQLKRTPAITGFQSGWKQFSIVNLHLHPGNQKDDKKLRKKEVELLMKLIKTKMERKEKGKEYIEKQNLILLGDTNLYGNNTDIVELITKEGFKESAGLTGKPTTTSLKEIYDRIFLNVDKYFKLMKNDKGVEKGGVFNLYDYVFRDDEVKKYHKEMKEHKNDPSDLETDENFEKYYHRYWKRNQISDHLPVWIEIETDSSVDFLLSKKSKLMGS